MKRKLLPLSDKIIVKRDETEQSTPGGILLPDVAQKQSARGEVLAVGPGKRSDDGHVNAVNVKVGQTVLFGKYAGNEVELDGEDYLILSESDILATLKE